jgi:hypothetical protein
MTTGRVLAIGLEAYEMGIRVGAAIEFEPAAAPESLIVRADKPRALGRYEIRISSGLLHCWAAVDELVLGDGSEHEYLTVVTDYGLRVAMLVKLPVDEGHMVALARQQFYAGGPSWELSVWTRGGEVVCGKCRNQQHGKCRGGNWCDCQHRVRPARKEAPSGAVVPPG